jgi:hypothetical protein
MINLTFFLLAISLPDRPDNLEQKACDYFFNNIFNKEYNEYKVIEFQNQTDTSKYWGVVYQCKNWDQTTREQITSATPGETVDVKANTAHIKVKRIRKTSGRLKVYVYSHIKVNDNYFVSIATYRKLRFAEYYFIKFDKEGNIIDTCKAGEII